MPIDEIVVTGRMGEDPERQAQRWQDIFKAASIKPNRPDSSFGQQVAGALYAGEAKNLAAYRAKKAAAAAAKKALPVLEKVAPAVNLVEDLLTPKPKYLPVLYKPPVMDEVIVTAKRLPRLASALGRASLPLTLAEVGGYLLKGVLREAGRQAFEELGQKVTRTVPARPDTPVQTIPQAQPAELMPEVIVTAKRRPRPTKLAERVNVDLLSNWFNTEMLRNTMQQTASKVGVSPVVALATPTVPQVKTRTKTKTKTMTDVLTQTGTLTDPLTGTRTYTYTLPATSTAVKRSTLLGIGTGVASSVGVITNPATITGVSTFSKLSQVSKLRQATKYCQPCPRKRKKRRKKCYRQLVKQGRTESRDKISKWAEINCETGRTIKELI